MAFETGQIVGDYEILDSRGMGGMGRVYRVRNVISNRVEAMKALQPSMTSEPGFAARFSAEIRTLASLDHPNIAQLRTAFQLGNEQLMIMECVEGSTLDKRAREAALQPSEIIAITRQILSALSYAHGRGVIHRDIKPANVMVTPQGVAKLMDFGIAKSAAEDRLTQPGSTVGSFYYISPEQVRGEAVDARSDVYSVGVLLYELLAGRRPFEAETPYALLDQQLNRSPQPPIELNPGLPQALNDLVLMAMAKDPAQRFQSADAFDRALKEVAEITISSFSVPAHSTIGESNPDAFAASMFASANTPQPQLADSACRRSASASFVPAAAPPKAPVAPASLAQHRTVWVTAGALAVVLVFIGGLILAPRFSKIAAKSGSAPHALETAKSPTPAPHSQTPITRTEPLAAPTVSVSNTATASPTGVAVKATVKRARNETLSTHDPVQAQPQQGTAAASQPQQPVVTGPSNEDLEQAEDELTKLSSRAAAVAGSVDRLQQQQAADGLGLRHDMAGAYSRMDSYLRAANNDLAEKKLTAVHRHMDLAEKEISILESFFNK